MFKKTNIALCLLLILSILCSCNSPSFSNVNSNEVDYNFNYETSSYKDARFVVPAEWNYFQSDLNDFYANKNNEYFLITFTPDYEDINDIQTEPVINLLNNYGEISDIKFSEGAIVNIDDLKAYSANLSFKNISETKKATLYEIPLHGILYILMFVSNSANNNSEIEAAMPKIISSMTFDR